MHDHLEPTIADTAQKPGPLTSIAAESMAAALGVPVDTLYGSPEVQAAAAEQAARVQREADAAEAGHVDESPKPSKWARARTLALKARGRRGAAPREQGRRTGRCS